MKKRIFAVFTLICVAVLSLLCSCGGKISGQEAKEQVRKLVKESYHLNVIFFGDGLPFEKDEDDNSLYSPVSQDALYQTKDELAKKTREIFSQSYATSMLTTAFNGVTGADGVSAVYARYIVNSDGKISVYENIKSIVEGDIATYYLTDDAIEITKISKRFVQANIKTEKGDAVSVTLVKESDGWRIDSATY